MVWVLIFYSLVGGLFSLAGGLLLLARADWAQKIMPSLLAFAAGAFLGAALLDILPEAIEAVAEPHSVLVATLAGFIAYFVLERLLMRFRRHAEHHHSAHTETLPFLLILGDSIHNFLDGIIIALAYIANPILGLTATLGVAAHEVPQEIGEFSVLLNQGWARKRIILVNVGQSFLAIFGVLVGYYLSRGLEPSLPYLLGAVAGIFLYIAASDLIPEIHHRAGHRHFYRIVLPLVASLLILWFFINLAHGA